MELIDNPLERTTAATDAVLAVLLLLSLMYLRRIGRSDRWKANIWSWSFGFLMLGAALGAIAHGFKMSPKTNWLLWQPLSLFLGLTIAMFVTGVMHDLAGREVSRRALFIMVPLAIAFYITKYAASLFMTRSFIIFIIFEALGMIFALGIYAYLTFRGGLRGAALMTAGVLVTIIAAAVQASRAVRFTLIWRFDHNGAFHIIQMFGILLLLFGLRADLKNRMND